MTTNINRDYEYDGADWVVGGKANEIDLLWSCYVCTYMNTYMHTYIHTYTHTHTHTHT